MYKQFKDINSIRFPVFRLKDRDWFRQDGVLFSGDNLVIDDTNMPGESLGIRRLQCGRKDLLRLKRAYMDFPAMLKSKHNIFVDSNGVPFIYQKTITADLKSHLILKIELKDTCSIVWCKDIPFPFTIKRPPYGDARYANILYLKGSPWVLYSFSTNREKNSHRRV